MNQHTNNLIVGQGLAGTTLAWCLFEAGQSVVLIDRAESTTASSVSAGLVTPWTGRRMTHYNGFDADWNAAVNFYRLIECRLAQPLFTEQPMVRIFVNRSDEEIFDRRMTELQSGALQRWSGQLQSDGPEMRGCLMKPAGRLDVKRYLRASTEFFCERGLWYQVNLSLPDGLLVKKDVVRVPDLELSADRVIFCQGAVENPWFRGIPNNPSRGDVINVQLDQYQVRNVVHHSIWLVPEADGSVTAGSTYDWNFVENSPTTAGRREILRAMKRIIEGPLRVRHHTAAVRPTMKDYRPVIYRHADLNRLWIFNGLGSRGVLLAPRLAQRLVELMSTDGENQLDKISSGRSEQERWSLTEIAQSRIAKVIQHGHVVVDATVGNGFDTCFLANRVGRAGLVYGFDVQSEAIESTRKRLAAAGICNVELLHQCHSKIHRHISEPVCAAMFNLGYLPRGDHSIVTTTDTTLTALEHIMESLVAGGMITVLAYRGHQKGPKEATAVESWLRNQQDCTVERIDSRHPKNTSPVLFILTKGRSRSGERC